MAAIASWLLPANDVGSSFARLSTLARVSTSVMVASILVPVITSPYSRDVKRDLPATADDNHGMNCVAVGADRMVP
ncbi:MAG: hypothetical protein GPOALKHO_000530 [Sodalis sp.]|nr:MAG: hypothetical protein GPOALKHO_000530 [Sodalis sp.]